MKSYCFYTPTAMPLESVSIMGINAKTKDDAIGRFGTGLKYAIAVILRNGGSFQLFVRGVEYQFYTHKKEFRGKLFDQVRMRKRYGLGSWLSSKALPFTTELGKDWKLWQAYRELESNTRDENGMTGILGETPLETIPFDPEQGTKIIVSCAGLEEVLSTSQVFLQPKKPPVFSNALVDIYDQPSPHMYFNGIRVYTPRNPCRLTYDFKGTAVQLTEDRTAANAWYLFHYISTVLQHQVADRGLLYKALNKSAKDAEVKSFETSDLQFEYTEAGSEAFALVATSLGRNNAAGYSLGGWISSHGSYVKRQDQVAIYGEKEMWMSMGLILGRVAEEMADLTSAQEKAVHELLENLRGKGYAL